MWEGNKAQAAALEPDVYNTESIVEQASDIFLHIFVFPIDATSIKDYTTHVTPPTPHPLQLERLDLRASPG